MGDSIAYEEHLDQNQLQIRHDTIRSLQWQITAYTALFIITLSLSLMANGVIVHDTLIHSTGCWIGLDQWYYWLTALILVKVGV
jgi:hypothetical protein